MTVEWVGHFVLWVILVTAAVLVVVWEFSFTPNVHRAAVDNFLVRRSTPLYSNCVVLFSINEW